MSDTEWIEQRVEALAERAECFFIPATCRYLAEIPGRHRVFLWAIGASPAEAKLALRDVLRGYFQRQLAALAECSR